jgi:hypothetical protein
MRPIRFRRLRRRLSYANVMATLAFFFALTGGAMAGVKYLTSSDPINAGDLAGSTYGNPVIATGKVTTGKVADGAITSAKFDSAATAPNAAKLRGFDITVVSRTYTVEAHGVAVGNVLTCPRYRIALHSSFTDHGTDIIVFPVHGIDPEDDGFTRSQWHFDISNDSGSVPESATVNLFCFGSENVQLLPSG